MTHSMTPATHAPVLMCIELHRHLLRGSIRSSSGGALGCCIWYITAAWGLTGDGTACGDGSFLASGLSKWGCWLGSPGYGGGRGSSSSNAFEDMFNNEVEYVNCKTQVLNPDFQIKAFSLVYNHLPWHNWLLFILIVGKYNVSCLMKICLHRYPCLRCKCTLS